MKRQMRFLFIVAIVVGLSILITGSALSQSTTQNTPMTQMDDGIVQKISPEGYTPPDQNWPIVKREFYSYVDSKTGATIEVETIWRKENPQSSALPAEEINCNQFQSLAGDQNEVQNDFHDCVNMGNESQNRTTRVYKSSEYLEMRHISYATKYCPQSVGCGYFTTFYDMYRTEASWYRSSTHWTVKQAKYQWGCPLSRCNKCVGQYMNGLTPGTYADTVAWYNTYQSWIYYVTYSGFPEMTMSIDNGTGTTYPVDTAMSNAYYDGSFYQSLRYDIYWSD